MDMKEALGAKVMRPRAIQRTHEDRVCTGPTAEGETVTGTLNTTIKEAGR
jgi:hypothetical protein